MGNIFDKGSQSEPLCVRRGPRSGDRVVLKSGGPVMVVEEVSGLVNCSWFDGREDRSSSFSAAVLDCVVPFRPAEEAGE